MAEFGGDRRPKWRLCFRQDRQTISPLDAQAIAWKHQRDFNITVVDPPAWDFTAPKPFFATKMACQIANFIANREFLEQLPGGALENKTVVVIGKNCVAAGLAAAALGARVGFLCDEEILPHVQFNVKVFEKDMAQRSQAKDLFMATFSCRGFGRLAIPKASDICKDLGDAQCLDLIVATQSAAEVMFENYLFDDPSPMSGHSPRQMSDQWHMFDFISDIVPPGAPTKVIFACDGNRALPPDDMPDPSSTSETRRHTRSTAAAERLQEAAARGHLPADLEPPPEWHCRLLGLLCHRFPVLWVERQDPERPEFEVHTMRRYLPPMGASSAKCGCGGHPQKHFLTQRIVNFQWHKNNSRLKESLIAHNRMKQQAAALTLQQATASRDARWSRATGASGTLPQQRQPFATGDRNIGPPVIDRAKRNPCNARPQPGIEWRTEIGAEVDEVGDGRQVDLADLLHESEGTALEAALSRHEPRSLGSDRAGWCGAPDDSLVEGAAFMAVALASSKPSTATGVNERRQLASAREAGTKGHKRNRGSRRETTIVERLMDPPHWYRSNRPVYGL